MIQDLYPPQLANADGRDSVRVIVGRARTPHVTLRVVGFDCESPIAFLDPTARREIAGALLQGLPYSILEMVR